MKLLLLSDIHGNIEALRSVIKCTSSLQAPDAVVIIGDVIDYGMHSNEAIQLIKELPDIICNIWGNHESSIIHGDYSRFSSERGKESAKYTKSALTGDSLSYIGNSMINSGKYEFMAGNKKCLAVHGSIHDEYWGTISPDVDAKAYSEYDYVFSGHSHIPHFFEKYVKTDDPKTRNKKKIIFINPGSVGQPRNLNNMAQFAVLDTETEEVLMKKTEYDITEEQKAYHGQVDDFYRERLELGI